MRKPYVVATCLLLIITLFSGCENKSKSKTEAGVAKVIEPSQILSKDDAKELTGVNFGEGTVKEQPKVGQKLCVYEKDGAFLQVGITQTAFMDEKSRKFGNTPVSIYKSTKEAFQNAEKIDGIGNDNFLAPPGLHIVQDGYYLTVSFGVSNDREKLKTAGMRAVANLKKYTAQK
jgi:hypothetical protein